LDSHPLQPGLFETFIAMPPVNCPISNIQVKAAENCRAWASLTHLKDIDVIYYIQHSQWSPDELETYNMFVRTKAYRLGVDLARSNYVFDWNNVVNNVFVARSVNDIMRIYLDVKTELDRDRAKAQSTSIFISGCEYTAFGRDQGSASLLYSILSLSVSASQLQVLRDDVLGNGICSRIILDDDHEAKFASSSDDLLMRVQRFADFFGLYVADRTLCLCAAILLFEADFTEAQLNVFVNRLPAIKSYMVSELDLESVSVFVSKSHPCLDKLYYSDNVMTEPWLHLPDFVNIRQVLEAPRNDQLYHCASSRANDVNSALDSFMNFWIDCCKPKTALFAMNLLAATTDFNHDYVFNDVKVFCDGYYDQFNEPCRVFIHGKNQYTSFSDLSIAKSATVNVYSGDGLAPFNLREGQNGTVIHRTDTAYFSAVRNFSRQAVFVFDYAQTKTVDVECATVRIPTTYGSSMSACFDAFRSFFGKLHSEDYVSFHGNLPHLVIMRFVPYHDEMDIRTRSTIRRLAHHYLLKFIMPRDFGGIDYTIYCIKRPKPLPKIHEHNHDPLDILDNFVYHSLSVRMGLLNSVNKHLVSWRIFAPFRFLVNNYGYGSTDRNFKVQKLLKFADWGKKTITDYNNLFGECLAPAVFNRGTVQLQTTRSSRRNQKKHGMDVGRSHLVEKAELGNAYLDREVKPKRVDKSLLTDSFISRNVNPIRYGDIKRDHVLNEKSPLFKRDASVRLQ
jgi:hypothetical protein